MKNRVRLFLLLKNLSKRKMKQEQKKESNYVVQLDIVLNLYEIFKINIISVVYFN